MTTKALIFDIDGTLALMSDRGPFEWARVGEDTPNEPVCTLLRMSYHAGWHIILMSGRDESCRHQTELWLDAQQLSFHELHMRPASDYRKDTIVKRELFEKYVSTRDIHVEFVVDDRSSVVKMWREELGLTCLQVAPGDF